MQDSHVYATTQLFHENQFLRSIIYRLELENNTLKGDPQVFSGPNSDLSVLPDKKMPGQSWLATIGPPVPLPVVNSFPPTPLAPLQIRPAPPVAENKPKKIISVVPEKPTKKKKKLPKVGPDANTEKQIYAKHSKENDNVTISDTTAVPCSKSITISNTTTETNIKTETSNQQFTFSITTPATLQATSDSELLRKKEPVQAVPLYPDHSHPANCSLAKNEQKQQQDDHTSNGTSSTPMLSPMVNYSSSIASSCCSNSVRGEEEEDRDISLAKSSDSTCTKSNQHEFDDLLLFDDDDNDTKGFQGIFKSFVDAGGDLDFSTDWNTTTEWNMDTLFDSF